MSTDSRRLPVPENSKPPCVFSNDTSTGILTENSERFDGRVPSQQRPIFATFGVITQARGSAYIEVGQTKVICAIYGPREAKFKDEFSLLGQITCEVKFATFSRTQRCQHQPGAAEEEASMMVKEALAPTIQLDKFPKSKIEVFIIILEDSGSALAAAITCASLALSDGGVEMFDLAVGMSLRRYGDITLIDPNRQEETILEEDTSEATLDERSDCLMTIGYLPSLRQVSVISQNGLIDQHTSQLCLKQAVDACHKVHQLLKERIMSATGRRIKSMKSVEHQLHDKPASASHAASASQNSDNVSERVSF